MKKTLCVTMALLLALGLAACGAPVATPTSAPSPSAAAAPAVVTFTDPVLEAMVRGSMGKPEGGITVAEAEAVTRLNLSNEWRRYVSGETPVKDISGLEYFKNLESLDLSFHAITDITPLAGMKKLTSLSLGGNLFSEIAPLSRLTNLKVLTLSGCAAQDYSSLAKLANLEFLMLNNSMIADLSPLAMLTSLTRLYITGCPIDDYSPLAEIYPNLEEKDFTIASSLEELGFTRTDGSVLASYSAEGLTVTVNHSEWGTPEMDMEANTIRLYLDMDDGYRLTVGCDPAGNRNYVFNISQNGENITDYIYISLDDDLWFDGDRERVEDAIRTMLGDTGSGDILLAPISVFNDTIREAFGITADALFALPFAPPSLKSVGFTPEETNVVLAYDQKEPHDMHIFIYKPEWGPLPDGYNTDGCNIEFYDDDVNGYSLLILYFADAGKYQISLFKDEMQYAFDYYPATNEFGQEYPDLDTVERMFGDAFGTQGEDFYEKPLAWFEQVVQEHFGMSIDELYALPIR